MSTFSAYYLQHRHPLKPIIDILLGRMTDFGILLHIRDKDLWREGKITREIRRRQDLAAKDSDFVKISLRHLTALWILLLCGAALALLAFKHEVWKEHGNRRKRHNVLWTKKAYRKIAWECKTSFSSGLSPIAAKQPSFNIVFKGGGSFEHAVCTFDS